MEFIKSQRDKYVTINEINAELERQSIKMSLSTIYRYMDYLETEQLISKHIDANEKKSYFRYTGDNPACKEHLHLKCNNCGITIHLPADILENANIHNFKIEYDSSVIVGICEDCQ